MIVHQAFFGEKEDSHNLLVSSINDKNLIGELKSITDAPGSVIVKYKYLSGYIISTYYVFCITMPDITASRKGMVFSHCLIIPLDELSSLNNLNQLFDCFSIEPVKDCLPLKPLEIDLANTFEITMPPKLYNTVVYELLNTQETIIFIGYNSFEDNIKYLWINLPCSVRANFSFTLSGSPNELQENSYTIVHTSEKNKNRWDEYTCINAPIDVDFVNYLSSSENDQKRRNLEEFINDYQIKISYLNQYPAVLKCYSLFEEVKERLNTKTLRRLIPLIEKMFPKISEGIKIKEEILSLFIKSFKNASCKEILSIRNLQFESFNNGLDEVKLAFYDWCETKIVLNSDFNKLDTIIETSFLEKRSNWWNEVIKSRIKIVCHKGSTETAAFLWFIVSKNIALLEILISDFDNDFESMLVDSFPNELSSQIYGSISKISLQKGWLALYAKSNTYYLTLCESISLQLKNDKTKYLLANIKGIISKRYSEFIEYAIHTNNKIIHELAGEVCAQNTNFLKDIDVTNENWQAIWFESYKHTEDIIRGIKSFNRKVYCILDLLVDGEGVNLNLLECISTSDGLDILNYPKREQLWVIINKVTKENLLSQVSYQILKDIRNVNFYKLEEDILWYMRSDFFIEKNVILTSESLKLKCIILEGLNILTEEKVLKIIKNDKIINLLDGWYISELIKKNEWENILTYIFVNRENKNYKSILHRCYKNLTFMQKFFFGKNLPYSNKADILDLIDDQKLHEVFKILKGIVGKENKSMYKRLQVEYVAGVAGIQMIDLCERLKTFVHTLDVD